MDALKTRFQELSNDQDVMILLLGACFFAMFFSVMQDMYYRYLQFKATSPSDASKKDEGKDDKEVEPTATSSSVKTHSSATGPEAPKPKKAFALPDTPLPAPNLSRKFTPKELLKFDGSDVDKPIYVAIKGNVFDVSAKKDMYGPKGGYKCFAGRDSSKALGLSSLKAEDCIADYSSLDEKELKVLENWYTFFEKRYAIVGVVKA